MSQRRPQPLSAPSSWKDASELPNPDVVHVIDSLLGWGGAEKRLVAEVLSMPDLRHLVVRVFERNELDEELLAAGVPVVALGLQKAREGIAIPRAIWRLRRLVAEVQPTVLHTSLLLSNLIGQIVGASFRPRVPVVSSLTRTGDPLIFRRYFSPTGAKWKLRILDWVTGRVGRMAHVRYRAVADHVKTTSSRAMGVESDRITVIPRGIDVSTLQELARRDGNRASFGLGNGPLFVNVGRIARKNGQVHLIKAFNRVLEDLPDATLAIAGEGEDAEEEVKTLIEGLGIEGSVKLLGFRPDAPALMSVADVAILSSLTEGLPGVLLEGMAVGSPMIAFDVPGSREASNDGECVVLVPPGAEEQLGKTMVALYQDEMHRSELAKAGMERARTTYDLGTVTRQLSLLLESAGGRFSRG